MARLCHAGVYWTVCHHLGIALVGIVVAAAIATTGAVGTAAAAAFLGSGIVFGRQGRAANLASMALEGLCGGRTGERRDRLYSVSGAADGSDQRRPCDPRTIRRSCRILAKRRFGVKDSSGLISGHGGLPDRLDGLFVVTPTVSLMTLFSGRSVLVWQ